MNYRSLFNKAVVAGLLATTVLATGCQQYQSPEEKAQATTEQILEQAGVQVDAKACVVTDKNLKGDWYGSWNAYDFKNGAVHFDTLSRWQSTLSMKDLAEDGQARAQEMFKHLPPSANCKPPKFGQ